MWNRATLLLLLLLHCWLPLLVVAYPYGGPAEACRTMMPSHGAAAQTGTSPFTVEVMDSVTSYRPNRPIRGECSAPRGELSPLATRILHFGGIVVTTKRGDHIQLRNRNSSRVQLVKLSIVNTRSGAELCCTAAVLFSGNKIVETTAGLRINRRFTLTCATKKRARPHQTRTHTRSHAHT